MPPRTLMSILAPRRGRPPRTGAAATHRLTIWLTADERELLRRTCEPGESLSGNVRDAAIDAARKRENRP